MELHNLMEDIVLDYLEEILELKTHVCGCGQCKMDMAAYALNKVKPIYIVSSRGIVHTQNKKRNDIQNDIDTYSVVLEAVDVISRTPRHETKSGKINMGNQDSEIGVPEISPSSAYYNFPMIVGRILDGETMMPIDDARVKLQNTRDNSTVLMFNQRWQNPQAVVVQMEGSFSFWPVPEGADKEGIQKTFEFSLKIEKNGYETINRYFEAVLVSKPEIRNNINQQEILHLDDIYLNRPLQNMDDL